MCLILVVLRVLISQSKEETVLSRLQELGLHVHITIATLVQHKGSKRGDEIDGRKVSEDELAVPEHVFARFVTLRYILFHMCPYSKVFHLCNDECTDLYCDFLSIL